MFHPRVKAGELAVAGTPRADREAPLTLPDRPSPARLGAAPSMSPPEPQHSDGDFTAMEKLQPPPPYSPPRRRQRRGWFLAATLVAGTITLAALLQWKFGPQSQSCDANARFGDVLQSTSHSVVAPGALVDNPYGQFPKPNDPFRLLPCTEKTVPPKTNDTRPEQTWAATFDPDPSHWNWGPAASNGSNSTGSYEGRGIFLCGYLDVPLDYTNKSDPRIARLAVTKYQVSGLAHANAYTNSTTGPGKKSERTIVINPGGPGGSGTSYAWSSAVSITRRFSDAKYDVLGFDPRGVNISRPAVECFPRDTDRDKWYLYTYQHREVSPSPRAQMEITDAFNEAAFRACFERHGDLGRFLTTAFVARDLDEIRKALDEPDLTGYLVSYGTGIGQTYAGMFPNHVGRMILDGTEYVRDHRTRGGFGWTALDNATDAWRDGFLGECLNAGPEYCALAKSRDGKPVTVRDLMARLEKTLSSLIARPIPWYLDPVGATLITRSFLIDSVYSAMYSPRRWPTFAQLLYDLEGGNATLAASRFEVSAWWYDPSLPCPEPGAVQSDAEVTNLVICSDQYDSPEPDTMDWWEELWGRMTKTSWIAGNSRFHSVFPCRHYSTFWPKPAEVFRGDMNHTLKTPVLLVAETYDPATPLRNGRRLHAEMGWNARLVVHHGYGHASGDTSNCTDAIAKGYILEGKVPETLEVDCYANEKPYLYGVVRNSTAGTTPAEFGVPELTVPGFKVAAWRGTGPVDGWADGKGIDQVVF
ncbi:hypothetical protein OQA88_1375 [Cercophora sp. LCS_1]